MPNPKSKCCYNCRFAGYKFKIEGLTHLHCQNTELYPEKDCEEGKVSPWETLREFYSKCDLHEFKSITE